ncbi:hypothetical protein ACJZ2D_009671 [Fusarium nematophilum]
MVSLNLLAGALAFLSFSVANAGKCHPSSVSVSTAPDAETTLSTAQTSSTWSIPNTDDTTTSLSMVSSINTDDTATSLCRLK